MGLGIEDLYWGLEIDLWIADWHYGLGMRIGDWNGGFRIGD